MKLIINLMFLLALNFTVSANCGIAMDSLAFKSYYNQVSRNNFDDAKLTEMEQALSKKCFSSEQIKQLLKLLAFEEDKLKLARKALAYVTDPENYTTVLSAFDFEASKAEIKKLMTEKK